MELAGRVALITGAGRRIGASLALALARRGVHVAIHHHQSDQEANQLAMQLRELGVRAATFQADLSQESQLSRLPARVADHMGPATLLINNAAIFEPGSLATTSWQQWQRHLDINLTAPFLLTQAFVRQLHLQRPPPFAKVIHLLDQRIIHPKPGHLAYTVSKSALWTLTQISALELAPHILVNGIGPGPILAAAGDDPHRFQAIADTTPLAKPGTPADVAAAMLFLLEQDYLTGQIIHVDGGQHLL